MNAGKIFHRGADLYSEPPPAEVQLFMSQVISGAVIMILVDNYECLRH